MKQFVCRLFKAGAIAAVVSILSIGVANAATTQSPEVVRGLTWLQSQVQPAGTLANEATSIATPLQNRAESLQTFRVLATVPTALADVLASDTQDNTEYLARRAVTLNAAGRDASAIINRLLARQNSDGGFSGAANYDSNALDTTWVMLALGQNAQGSTVPAQKARSYLLASIQADGGVGAGSDSSRINANALALLALQMFPQDLNTATALKQISSWLLLKQGADGSWLKNSNLTALALAAVSPLVSDPTISTTATTYLKALQGVDGSWGGGDPFLTAVVLRALGQGITGVSAAISIITGKVFDQATSTALAGATVVLSGAAAATTTTAADGSFSFPSLSAGSYTLQAGKSGYANYTNTYQVNTSQTLNVGTIALAQSLNTGIVNGKVTDAATGLPLSGVTMVLNGGTTTVTDANGVYTFTGVAPGTVSLSASLAGYVTASGTGFVMGGLTLVYSPALATAAAAVPTTGIFTGKITAAGSGAPLAGVGITLNGTASGVTAADGSFNLTLAPGSYTAAFTLTGYNPATFTFMLTAGATANTGTVALTPQLTSTTVSGIVKDATSGNPINGAQVQVLNGPVVTTGANGAYTLSGLAGNTFDLRISATGYVTQSLRLTTSQPANITQDFPLQVQSGLGLSLGALLVNPGSAASRTDITVATVISSAVTGTPANAVLAMQIIDAQGRVIGTGAAYDKTGTNMLGQIPLTPGQQLPVTFRWNTGQFRPGTYSLIARVAEAGTITRTTPLGNVLAQAQGTLTITSDLHFAGTVTADPPVLQANTNTPVHLSAIIVNDGNTDFPVQTYQLRITDVATGAAVATQQVNGTVFSANALQTLTFADWTPVAGGNFSIDIQAVGNRALGNIVGKVYVGDAATAAFTVNKLAVPAGTQSVKGNIHVVGQDSAQGVISDPLAPLIKAAIQKAVTYNDARAADWVRYGCTGCHVVPQALVAGELNLKNTTYNASQRNLLFNALSLNLQSDGSIYANHPEYTRTQTLLALWALNTWHKKEEIVSTLVKGADYLISTQAADGSWSADGPGGWWGSLVSNTSFNVKNLINTRQTLAQAPVGSAASYSLPIWAPGKILPAGQRDVIGDAAGNVYISSYYQGIVFLFKPDGTVQQLMTGLSKPSAMTIATDGSLYVATDGGGLKRRAVDGTVTTVTTIGGHDLAFAPDGTLYMAGNDGTVYQISPQGLVTSYCAWGWWVYPRTIAVTAAGELVVGLNIPGGGGIVIKYKADKTYEQVASPWGYISRIRPYGTGWLISGPGVIRYNSEWQAEKLVSPSSPYLDSLNVLPNGQVFGADSNQVYLLQKNPVGVATELSKLDAGIDKATNWLLVDTVANSSSNLELAHRLIGLGEANKRYLGSPMAATIQTKMNTIGALLKSHQLTDGGWGQTTTDGSDSMVTAQVGMALDYLNPLPSDPTVQNAIKLLLNRQQADGSWLSENNILATHLAATTWVAIWLPIALDRIGGINTDLSVSTQSNVTLSNPSLAPTSSAANAAGGMDYLWKLQGVTSSGQDIGFDLSLASMVLGENRPVASDAHLTFNNTFTGLPVKAPISVPRVTASAFLGVGVTTDQVSYPANTPVSITAAVNNTSTTGPLGGSVKLGVYSADNMLVGVAGTIPFTGLAVGAQTSLTGTWGTSTNAAGGYYVLATLYDAQNRFVGTAKSLFNIVAANGAPAGATGVSATVTFNKQAYQPYDVVQVTSRVSNQTLNQAQNGLTAVVTIYGPAGAVMGTQTTPLKSLVAGTFVDVASSFQLSSAPAGQYSVIVVVQNGATVVAQSTSSFTVLSTANTGNGLKGTIGALPKIVPQTDPVVLNWTASNLGNADFAALPVKLTIVDPVTRQAMTQQTYSVALLQGKTYQTAFTWDTSPANVGSTYIAILAATVGGKDIVLAQDNFLVTYPPVKLGVTQNSVRESRVLVWLACESEETHKADGQQSQDSPKSSDSQRAGQGSNSAASGNDHASSDRTASDKDHAQPLVPLCIQTRTIFLQGLLSSLKAPYLITANQDDFTKAFREGRYNVYWLSGGIKLAEKDAAHKDASQTDASRNDRGRGAQRDSAHKRKESDNEGLLEEIREAVYRGDSLILDGAAQDNALREAAGVTYSGQFSSKNLQLSATGPLFTVQTLPTQGTAQKMTVTTGASQATFVVPVTPDDHQNNDSQDHGQQGGDAQGNSQQGNDRPSSNHSGGDHQAEDAHQPAPVWPAIVSNDYGRGHALDFGFDLVGSLQNSTAPASWPTLLQTGLTNLLPPLPTTYSAGAYVGLNTGIQNQARAVDLAVATQLPAGSTLLSTLPKATLDANGQPSWLFILPQAATQALQLSMRLPSLSGTHKALTTIDSIRNGTSRRYGEYAFYWTVAASDTVGGKLVTDLRALALTKTEEIKARDRAVAKLQQALGYIGQAKYVEAINALLKAVEKLCRITSVDVSSYRLSLDSLLQETEWNWLRTGGATQPPAAPHTENEAVNK